MGLYRCGGGASKGFCMLDVDNGHQSTGTYKITWSDDDIKTTTGSTALVGFNTIDAITPTVFYTQWNTNVTSYVTMTVNKPCRLRISYLDRHKRQMQATVKWEGEGTVSNITKVLDTVNIGTCEADFAVGTATIKRTGYTAGTCYVIEEV